MLKRKARRSRTFRKNNQVIDFESAREDRRKRRDAVAGKTRKKEIPSKAVPSKRRQSRKNRRKTIYTAILLVIIAVVGISVFNIISVRAQRDSVLDEQARGLAEKERLQKELQNVDSPEYVEQQARMLLRMIRPGEVLYILPEPSATPPAGGDTDMDANAQEAQ